jgi:thiamine-phosphate pyrophosphorylase
MAKIKPQCRLYLQFPMAPSATLSNRLSQVLAEIDAACVLLYPEESAPGDNAIALVDLIQRTGIACLIANDAELASRSGADGVHIDADPVAYREARKHLGPNANIGAGCGLSRHDAMVLAEMGADYVAFGAQTGIDATDRRAELIAWWSEIFVVPCVAWNIATPDQAWRAASLGADFVAPPLDLWRSEQGVQLIAAIERAVRQARSAA